MKSIANIVYPVLLHLNKLKNLGIRKDDSIRKKKLIALSNIFTLVICSYMLSMGISVFLAKEHFLATFDFTMLILYIINFIIFMKFRKLEIYSDIIIILVGIMFIYLTITGGKNGTGPIWSIPFPLFALYLKGPRKGTIYSVTFMGLMLLIFNATSVSWIYDYKNKFENYDIISSRIILTQLALYIISFFFSKNRDDLFNEIEAAINEKTNFFINLTHETKTPLILIRNYLERYIEKQGINNELLIIKQNIQKL
ncbi:MAG: hypothetical protein JXB88_18860, partial [Spirochaetales bacterium]|nr:hypothetical protein [Spirochaetales bacterium]